MAPSYKLHYFDFPGRAEVIRMLLSYGGLDFEDIRIPREDWLKVKQGAPFGQAPFMEIDGKMVCQSGALSRYLAKQVKLAGNNDWEDLEIDMVVDAINDLSKQTVDYAFEKDEVKKKNLEEKLLNETIPYYLKRFDDKAKANGGYLAIKRLTWVDLFFVCQYEGLINRLKKDVFVEYANLLKVKENVLAVPAIREWIKKRPTVPMFTYDLRNEL